MGPSVKQPNAAPAMPEPVRIPNPMDPDVLEARKKKVQAEFDAQKGRDSTRLTPAAGTDAAYSRTTLG